MQEIKAVRNRAAFFDANFCTKHCCQFTDFEYFRSYYSTIKKAIMIDKVTVKIINKSNNDLPQYSTPSAAGMDLRANLSEAVTLSPLERKLIPTGIFIELPEGYECQIRPRSGLALKHGISVLNSPGTIDADYRGEIGVILANLSNEPFVVNPGERICQMVVARHSTVVWQTADSLSDSERGAGGFGHTGVK